MKKIFVVLLLLVGAVAHADRSGDMREKLREKVRAIRIARMIDELGLDEKETAKVMPIVDKFFDDMGAVAKDAGQARRDLRQQTEADKPDEAKINKLIDQLVADHDKQKDLESGMIRELRKVLTPEQTGKLVVVLPEINRNIQQRIRRAAMRRMQQNGPGGDDDGQ